MIVTASMLYDFVQCPHRVFRDSFDDPAAREPVNPFVELLWDKGALYEAEVIRGLDAPFLDLSVYGTEEKTHLAIEAMQRGEPLIYSGRIESDDLVGIPDLLRREGNGYVPGDIKSGAGEEGAGEDGEGKPKKHYAVQLALYVDVLERLGLSAGRRGFVWDIHGEEVSYDLTAAQGPKTPASLWDVYQSVLAETRAILAKEREIRAAYGGVCKLCHWYSSCLANLGQADDLTLIPDIGRPKRDVMISRVATVAEFAAADPETFITGKKTEFKGIGPDMLRKLHRRAQLVHSDGAPFLREPIVLLSAAVELFFDIEYDPMRDICYLHGFVERRNGDNATERYIRFLAEEPTHEKEECAFAEAWAYMQAADSSVIYYYAPYERTRYRKLQERYPHVCTAEEIESIFAQPRSVDLYTHVVRKATEWPTRDHSIKTLAKYLGFEWRDTNPSGAASIRWFHDWIETRDPTIRDRILLYNEDDCRATRVILDGIRNFG